MDPNELKMALARLAKMSVTELRAEYAKQFGDETLAGNRVWLQRRIGWRLQERAEGGLSERTKRRAAELADDAWLRTTPPREKAKAPAPTIPLPTRDPRLPMPGTVLARNYKGHTVQVLVATDGFEYEGESFRTLSAVAKRVSGMHTNGFLFFGLVAKKGGVA